eukprot:m.165868 g.165868  ORF g.165868 m.165868 type:complete len:53 (+) comp16607_c0_seq2:1916-2074(+)
MATRGCSQHLQTNLSLYDPNPNPNLSASCQVTVWVLDLESGDVCNTTTLGAS